MSISTKILFKDEEESVKFSLILSKNEVEFYTWDENIFLVGLHYGRIFLKNFEIPRIYPYLLKLMVKIWFSPHLSPKYKPSFKRDIKKLTKHNVDFFMGGDLNAYNIAWNCSRNNSAGTELNRLQNSSQFKGFYSFPLIQLINYIQKSCKQNHCSPFPHFTVWIS